MAQQIKKKFLDPSLIQQVDSTEQNLAQELIDRAAGDSALQSQIDTEKARIDAEKARIDAILEASSADKDSFKEIVDLINSVDTENDQAFAGYVLSNDARVAQTEERLDVVEPKVEELEDRLVKEENINKFLTASFYNDAAAVYADGEKGMEDPSALTRDGWYFQNLVAGKKFNWYFHDGTQQTVTLENFSAYTVMTFDSVATTIFGLYTAPTGTNDVIPGFAHSRIIYSVRGSAPVVGKKYVVYFGSNPDIHPELPRIQLTKNNSLSLGEQLPSEVVFTCSLGSDSGASANSVKFMIESLGVYSPSFKSLITLKIKHVSKEEFNSQVSELESKSLTIEQGLAQEILDRQAGDAATLDSAKAYGDDTFATKEALAATQADLSQFSQELSDAISAEEARAIAAEEAVLESAKEYTDSQIAAIPAVDLSNYYTKPEVDSKESALEEKIESVEGGLASEIQARIDGDAATLEGSKEYTDQKIADLVGSAPELLDTLGEIAEALENEQTATGAILEQLADHESRIESSEQEITEIKTRLDSVEAKNIAQDQKDEELEGKIESSEQEIVGIKSRLDSIEDANEAQNEKDQELEGRIEVLESAVDGPFFSSGSVVVGSELGYVDLDKEYIKLMSVSVSRATVHEGEDFTVSVVEGKTRLTWINSLANPNGAEKIESGDKVFWVGAHSSQDDGGGDNGGGEVNPDPVSIFSLEPSSSTQALFQGENLLRSGDLQQSSSVTSITMYYLHNSLGASVSNMVVDIMDQAGTTVLATSEPLNINTPAGLSSTFNPIEFTFAQPVAVGTKVVYRYRFASTNTNIYMHLAVGGGSETMSSALKYGVLVKGFAQGGVQPVIETLVQTDQSIAGAGSGGYQTGLAQSFKVAQNSTITEFALRLSTLDVGDFTVSLKESSNPSAPNLAVSNTLSLASGLDRQMVAFTLPTTSLDANKSYFIHLNWTGLDFRLNLGYTASNYVDGDLFRNQVSQNRDLVFTVKGSRV